MQVNIRVTRQFSDGTHATFECTDSSIEGAIKIADQLATGKADTVADAKANITKEVKADAKKDTVKDSAKDAAKSNTAAGKTSETETTAGTTKETEAGAPNYDAVKKAITGVASAKGRESAVAMLQRFGATSGATLKAEQYAEVLEMADKILNAGFDPMAAELPNEDALA
jgi:phosphopentomutase